MTDLGVFSTMFRYGDWADTQLLAASAPLADTALDTPFDMGPGSLRRTLLHIHAGEEVWLRRWIAGRNGHPAEPKWPAESERASVTAIGERMLATRQARDEFLASQTPQTLTRVQVYRDSKGSLFKAPLGDMIQQCLIHSIHHRAQAVNMLRRLGAEPPELDYMMWVRKPAS